MEARRADILLQDLPGFLRLCVERGVLELESASQVAAIYRETLSPPEVGATAFEQASAEQVLGLMRGLSGQLSQALAQASQRLAQLEGRPEQPATGGLGNVNPGRHADRDPHEALERLKQMMSEAETPEEQALALQIALGERLLQLRDAAASPATIEKIERALELVRGGEMGEAVGLLKV